MSWSFNYNRLQLSTTDAHVAWQPKNCDHLAHYSVVIVWKNSTTTNLTSSETEISLPARYINEQLHYLYILARTNHGICATTENSLNIPPNCELERCALYKI